MDRNTTLAFALSMIVFVVYVMYQEDQRSQQLELQKSVAMEQSLEFEDPTPNATASRPTQTHTEFRENGQTGDSAGSGATAEPGSVPALPGRTTRVIPLRTLVLENADVTAKISNGPALIESWRLRQYEEFVADGETPVELITEEHPALIIDMSGISYASFANAHFEIVSHGGLEIVQRAETEAGVLTRTIRLDESGYGFDLEMDFESSRSDPIDAGFEILWPAQVSTREDFTELSLLAYSEEVGVTRTLIPAVGQGGFFDFGNAPVDGIEIVEGRSNWAGFDIQYFAGVLIDAGEDPRLSVKFEPLKAPDSAFARIALPSVSIGSGGSTAATLRGFLGPKTETALAAAGSDLGQSVNRGFSWLAPLTRLFEIALDSIYVVIPNYGFAIIVLTILVRIFTAPLMAKQMRSAERMRALQPRMEELKERFKDDRQKHSEETMKLYREEKVNPIAGCLPLILQFPILIGLFYALRSSIALRHADFALWITDLSQPATLFVIPGVDFPVRLLPLIMGASMFVQQKMTPTTGMDPTQARMMLIMMPTMMLFFSYTFPSGLVLYWTVSNLLGIAQQYWIRSKTQPAS